MRSGVLAPPQPLGARVPRGLTRSGRRRERLPCPATTPGLVPVPEARALPGLQVACRAGEGRQGGVGGSEPEQSAVLKKRLSAWGKQGEDLRWGASWGGRGFQATTDGNTSSPGGVDRPGSALSRHAPTTPARLKFLKRGFAATVEPHPRCRRIESSLGSHHSPAVGHSRLHSGVLLRSGESAPALRWPHLLSPTPSVFALSFPFPGVLICPF